MSQKIDRNRIYNLDCIKGMNSMSQESVDVIVTSPPYNIGIQYNLYQDNKL